MSSLNSVRVPLSFILVPLHFPCNRPYHILGLHIGYLRLNSCIYGMDSQTLDLLSTKYFSLWKCVHFLYYEPVCVNRWNYVMYQKRSRRRLWPCLGNEGSLLPGIAASLLFRFPGDQTTISSHPGGHMCLVKLYALSARIFKEIDSVLFCVCNNPSPTPMALSWNDQIVLLYWYYST